MVDNICQSDDISLKVSDSINPEQFPRIYKTTISPLFDMSILS